MWHTEPFNSSCYQLNNVVSTKSFWERKSNTNTWGNLSTHLPHPVHFTLAELRVQDLYLTYWWTLISVENIHKIWLMIVWFNAKLITCCSVKVLEVSSGLIPFSTGIDKNGVGVLSLIDQMMWPQRASPRKLVWHDTKNVWKELR